MICPPCKAAGYLLSLNPGDPAVPVQHKNCTAPTTCTCQHSIKSLKNQGTGTS